MGCCTSESEPLPVFYAYRQISNDDTALLINNRTPCWYCRLYFQNQYMSVTSCNHCGLVGHSYCVSKWRESNKICAQCKK